MLKRTIALGLVLISGMVAHSQVAPSAKSGSSSHLTLGAELAGFQIDAAHHPFMYGVTAYADYNPLSFLGLEVEGKTIQFHQQDDLRRDSISGGFRYISHYRQFSPYAKALAGIGSGDFPRGTYAPFCCSTTYYRQHDTFTTITFGGGVDYHLTHKIAIRGEYEYEYWLDYGGGPKRKLGTSNPNGFNIGASYRIF